jgi:LysM repeat protein
MPKKAEFKEDAYDGDNDGFVQDGTEFMRPEAVEVPVEAVEALVEAATTYVVTYGDTYPSIAAKFPKTGMTNYQRAKEIMALNKNGILTGKRVIKL